MWRKSKREYRVRKVTSKNNGEGERQGEREQINEEGRERKKAKDEDGRRERETEKMKGERQRKTTPSRPSDNANHFPLKLPFAPGQSSVSKAICPAERRATYIYLRGSNGPAKKGSGLVTFPERGKFRVRSIEGKQPEFSLSFFLFFSKCNRERRRSFSIRLSDVPDAITFSRCER